MRNYMSVVFVCLGLSVVLMCIDINSPRMEILIKDVGQGDGIIIYNEEGQMLLIDGGPSNEFVDMSFLSLPYLKCRLFGVLLTHPHSDHVFGLNRALELCDTGFIFFGDIPAYTSNNFSRFKELAGSFDSNKVRELTRGDELKFGNFTLYILWPTPESLKGMTADEVNEASIVVLLDYRDFEALLTGDINSDTQRSINLSEYSNVIDGSLDVYKVPHHGSKYSFDETFLALWKPKVAVVSVGRNSYGHPNKQFSDYFAKNGTQYFRTDLDGDVRIKIY